MRSFSSRFVSALPGDPLEVALPRPVTGALWSKVRPTPVAGPTLLAHAKEVADLLGLEEDWLRSPEGVGVLSGNTVLEGQVPWAANYGGHQFGHWAGQLGDGRAVNLGELPGVDGRRYELQLKGAGLTPYSRGGDGRAVLRSSIREFLCSEAMAHLGVPTTRALSLVGSGEDVVRDMFYDGNAAPEPGAIVCRVAESFLRFGNYELPTSRRDIPLLEKLVSFTLEHHFPELGPLSPASVIALFHEVARRTGRLIAHWQAVGFVHGVMNTDNMSVLGLTIDYGPYGWLDDFNPGWTPNTTDARTRRYCYGNQPQIGLWNLERFGEALSPLVEGDREGLEEGLKLYARTFVEANSAHFAAKLGFTHFESQEDAARVQALFDWLEKEETDFTLFFRGLSDVARAPQAPTAFPEPLRGIFYGEVPQAHLEAGTAWLASWWERTRREDEAPEGLAARMDRVNPLYVLRNWLSQEAIDAAHEGDLSKVHTLLEVMRRPFEVQPGREHFAQKRPEWARHKAGCSALSCSS
jgi:uncharacterized protein YdiU (UPF0061 family)